MDRKKERIGCTIMITHKKTEAAQVRTRIACLPEFPSSFASFSFILFYFSAYPMGFVAIAVS
jgi:hypothetical protein